MAEIEEAEKAVSDFLKKTLGVRKVKIIMASHAGECWEAEAEVYEESSFIKALGLHTRVQDRNVYVVRLNTALGVESYGLKGLVAQEEK